MLIKKLIFSGILFSIPLMIFAQNKSQIYLNPRQPLEKRVENALSLMTLEEKVALCHANSKFTIPGVPRLHIPELTMSDGPHGVREDLKRDSWEPKGETYDSCTYLPVGIALASTWNPDLARLYGRTLGSEARARGKDVILGPAINIQRTPLCGRNFEYMGEDPYLTSIMVVPYIQGVQSQGVSACVKHYFANNQEYKRGSIDVEMDNRTMYEIYLPGFKAAVEKGHVLCVMSSYNKFRGQHCSENDLMLNKILKGEFGFKGAVMSDWDAVHNTLEAANNGEDFEMGTNAKSYDDYYLATPFLNAIKAGQVSEKVLNDKVRRILRVIFSTQMSYNRPKGEFSTPQNQAASLKIAKEAVVLLKNEQNILPLNREKIKTITVIGENASRKLAYGGGSSGLKTKFEITPFEGLREKVGKNIVLNYARGYSSKASEDNRKLIQEAVEYAKRSDVALIFCGLNHNGKMDSEGSDRTDLKMPYSQNDLINAVAEVNPHTIVVLISGGALDMESWINKVPAVLQGWYDGMQEGRAFADILFGDVNPSGKLPCTFPKRLEDSPAHAMGNYPGKDTVKYEEGVMVGYRYFDTRNIQPRFCFGHGLSYTNFTYSDLKVTPVINHSGKVTVSMKLKNTGQYAGAEVVQLYLNQEKSSVVRPDKELKGFEKIFLNPGEEKSITFSLNSNDLSFYDNNQNKWIAEPGKFKVLIGSSSRDIRLNGEFVLKN